MRRPWRVMLAVAVAAGLAGSTGGCLLILAGGDDAGPYRAYPGATVVQRKVTGDSHGLSIAGVIPIVEPSLARAIDDAESDALPAEGSTQAWDNVRVRRRWLLVLIPVVSTLTVEADIVDVSDPDRARAAQTLTRRAAPIRQFMLNR